MIKWSRVAELREEIGEEDFAEVVEIFLEEVEETTAKLAGDYSASRLEQDLHFLKGSALNLGFEHFSNLCMDGEQLAANGQAAKVDVAEMLDCYAQSKELFLAELPKLGQVA